MTPRQLKKIIRLQAVLLCLLGIPAGLLLGYGIGSLLIPQIIMNTSISVSAATRSVCPVIFLFSALFAMGTVLLSCSRPGRIAAGVSPVEAARYTEATAGKKKKKRTSGAKIQQMAFSNLGRNRLKTALVVLSMALSAVLLNSLIMIVDGFDVEKYLSQQTCADFIVSNPEYFQSSGGHISQDTIREIQAQVSASNSGCGYTVHGPVPQVWMEEAAWRKISGQFASGEALEQHLQQQEHRGTLVADKALIEGLDEDLFEKLTVVAGTLAPLTSVAEPSIALAVHADDYEAIKAMARYPAIGDKVTVTYITEEYDIDSRTGEAITDDTPKNTGGTSKKATM